jgi:hypothetical protein
MMKSKPNQENSIMRSLAREKPLFFRPFEGV